MTTTGFKKCTLCGEEMLIDAILCPHCGKIPGRSPAPASAPASGVRIGPFVVGALLSATSAAVLVVGLSSEDSNLILAGTIGVGLGVGLLVFSRARRK